MIKETVQLCPVLDLRGNCAVLYCTGLLEKETVRVSSSFTPVIKNSKNN